MYGRGPQVGFGPPIFPDVVKAIIVANCVVYLLQALGPGWLTGALALTPRAVWEHGAVWQIATYMWLHAPESPLHLLFNMFALWMFGSQVAGAWGTKRFLRFYLVCGVLASLTHVFMDAGSTIPAVGASGAISGVLGAYLVLHPHGQVRTLWIFFIIIRVIYLPAWLLLGAYFLLQFAQAFYGGPDSGIAVWAHIGGFVAGAALIFLFRDPRRSVAIDPWASQSRGW